MVATLLLLLLGSLAADPLQNGGGRAALTLDDVLARASKFAEQQRDALTSVRADERYRQEIKASDGVLRMRRLESEIAFVQLSDSPQWMAYRNVMTVDDEPTGSDPARLEKLFRRGARAAQGRRIAEENAAYNIGRLYRSFNIPTFPMHLLMRDQLGRFKFKKDSETDIGGERVWELAYEERHRPTIVRTVAGGDVPVKGRMWIVPQEGRLLRATVRADVPVPTEIEFTWHHDQNLDAWVPFEMRERYRRILDEKSRLRNPVYYDIVAFATYSNYRRFGVDVRIR